jgi:hypothetical protein
MNLRSAACVVALACWAAQACAADPPERVARLSYVLGTASVVDAGDTGPVAATVNWPIVAGDRVHTDPETLAELDFGTATMWLDENTDLTLVMLAPHTIEARIASGAVSVELHERAQDDAVRLRMEAAGIDLLQPGSYRLDASDEAFIVHTGAAEIGAGVARFQQFAGEQARIATDGTLAITPVPPRDAFDRWTSQRAQRQDGSRTAPHVPKNLVGYQELDRYGAWRWERDYGMVWEPQRVSREWAPYRFGQWIWKPPWGWTWVDDAPWGFATAHSGRWAEIDAHWFWVPGPRQIPAVYAPALVGWVRDRGRDDRIGWFPLGPGEQYVPPYPVSESHARRLNMFATVNSRDPRAIQAGAPDTQAPRAITWSSHATFVREVD